MLREVLFSCALCLPAAPALAGQINVVGTGDGIELLRALGAAYTADNPDVPVIVPPSVGSGGAIAAVGADKEILGRIARPLNAAEKAQGLVSTPVVRLPSAFFVHPSAKVDGLTAAQIADIYAGKITNWKDLGGADLRIKVVRREDADSTLMVLRETMPGWQQLAITEKSKMAMTTQEATDSVKQVEGAIGFGPYTRQLEGPVTVLRVDGKFPTDDGYPSGVTIAFVHKDATLTPEARGFVAFTATPKAKALLSNMGGVPLSR